MYKNFMEETINVYRTKHHIVVQKIGFKFDCEDDNFLYSFDTFYERNKYRDREYENIFENKININGKRIKTAMYSRRYVRW